MCLIIVKPEDCIFNEDILDIAWDMNSHGAGFMVYNKENDTLSVRKGFFNKKDFIDEILKYQDQRIVVHFRYATHGEKDTSNCHPFRISSELALVHNGQMSEIKIWNEKYSDTWHFAQICKKFYKRNLNFWKHAEFKTKAESKMGRYNKVVWMDNKGQIEIYNEKEGTYLDGVWYSNLRFLFGSWSGLNEYYEREYVKKMGFNVKPYKLSWWAINEGESWFFCDHCCHLFNKEKHGNPIVIEEFYNEIFLCDNCNKKDSWMLDNQYRFDKTILDGWNVRNVYRDEMKRLQEKYKAKEEKSKAEEEAKKVAERKGKEVDTKVCSTL